MLMDSQQNKMLIFTGKPDNFPVWCERFLAYIEDKNLNVESEKVSEVNRDAVLRKFYQEIIMHLNDATMLINDHCSEQQEWLRNMEILAKKKHLSRFEPVKSLCFGKSFWNSRRTVNP